MKFNLSEKIISYYSDTTIHDKILVKHIKKFIKLLKEEFTKYDEYDKESIIFRINKLAGPKLT